MLPINIDGLFLRINVKFHPHFFADWLKHRIEGVFSLIVSDYQSVKLLRKLGGGAAVYIYYPLFLICNGQRSKICGSVIINGIMPANNGFFRLVAHIHIPRGGQSEFFRGVFPVGAVFYPRMDKDKIFCFYG